MDFLSQIKKNISNGSLLLREKKPGKKGCKGRSKDWEKPGKIPEISDNFIEMELANDIYQRIASAKMYIDRNYHESIDLDEISQQAFLSRFHFHRLFTKIYRRTPHQYLTQKRLDKARDLLSENKPVTEVCNEVGFES